MATKNGFTNIIKMINTGKTYPAMSLVKTNPDIAALLSKLIKPLEPRIGGTGKQDSFYRVDQSTITDVSRSITNRIRDSENIMQLFPDTELAAQILISSILSPKDMVSTEIIYQSTGGIFTTSLTMRLVDIVRNHLESHYELKNILPIALRAMLFESGAYAQAVIPESSVDEIINDDVGLYIRSTQAATESMRLIVTENGRCIPKGFLGDVGSSKETVPNQNYRFTRLPYQEFNANERKSTGLEGFQNILEITDNYEILKLPRIMARNRTLAVRERTRPHIATESITHQQLETLIYKDKRYGVTPFRSIKTKEQTERRSIGRPLVLHIPTESIIPVYVPGDETDHIGYFIMLDQTGNPISKSNQLNTLQDFSALMADQSNSVTSMLLTKARRNLVGQEPRSFLHDDIARIYADIVEDDLIERLRNGLYGENIAIAKNEDVYRIMLARALANQYTRLVYIPKEIMSYFALRYHENGVGKSLLDDLKILTSLRAILLFAKVMAQAKSSIAVTHVNMTLDPNDPDPQKTIELAVHEIIKMRQQYFPLGINAPIDLVDWVQRAGFEFTFEGHPGIPETKFEFESKNIQHTVPDSDLDELLRKQTFMALGLSPETVDNGFNAEFATTVVSNNILLSKRVLQIQEQFMPQVTHYARQIVLNDFALRSELIQALKDEKNALDKFLSEEEKSLMAADEAGFMELMVDRFADSLVLELPKPDITAMESQSTAYEQYADALDKAIDAWISTDILPSNLAGDLANNVDSLRAVIKSYFLRRWMAENGYMSELNEMISQTDEDEPTMDLFNLMKDHIEGLMRSCVKFVDALNPIKEAADKDLSNLGASETPEVGATGGGTEFEGGETETGGGPELNF